MKVGERRSITGNRVITCLTEISARVSDPEQTFKKKTDLKLTI